MADEEKKNGKISGFFKNLGAKINESTYDLRAADDYNKTHARYTVYTGSGVFSHTADLYCEERPGESYVIAPSEDGEIAPGQIITPYEKEDPRYIAAVEKTEISFEFEGKTNTKPALKITLGGPAEKVDVIKVGDSYYLKK